MDTVPVIAWNNRLPDEQWHGIGLLGYFGEVEILTSQKEKEYHLAYMVVKTGGSIKLARLVLNIFCMVILHFNYVGVSGDLLL